MYPVLSDWSKNYQLLRISTKPILRNRLRSFGTGSTDPVGVDLSNPLYAGVNLQPPHIPEINLLYIVQHRTLSRH